MVDSLDAVDIGEEVLVRGQVGQGREEVNNREKQEKDKHEETDKECLSTQTHGVARLEPCSEYAHLIVCKKCMRRMTSDVYLSTR